MYEFGNLERLRKQLTLAARVRPETRCGRVTYAETLQAGASNWLHNLAFGLVVSVLALGERTAVAKVVFVLHGIRTHAEWQRAFSEVAQIAGWKVRSDRWNFGYFSVLRLLLPGQRHAKVKWFRETYRTETRDKDVSLPDGTYPSIVAHSFGTYILGNALLKYDWLRFDKVVLCGSILPRDFPWAELFRRKQVKAVRNEYGTNDFWTRVVRRFVAGSGCSGCFGFRFSHVGFEQEKFEYDHSEYFEKGHMEAKWLPFLEATRPAEAAPIPSGGPIDCGEGKILKNIVLLACIGLLLSIGVYVLIKSCDSNKVPPSPPKPEIDGVEYLRRNLQGYDEYLHTLSGITIINPELDGSQRFLISKYEISQAQWRRVMGPGNVVAIPKECQGENFPMVGLSYQQCEEFCWKLSAKEVKFSIPTVEQWRATCRKGKPVPENFGKPQQECGSEEVNGSSPDSLGLHHMLGNVLEWCTDPNKESNIQPLRGGSWSQPALECTCDFDMIQGMPEPTTAGFRPVINLVGR
jgi:hypothetical protein